MLRGDCAARAGAVVGSICLGEGFFPHYLGSFSWSWDGQTMERFSGISFRKCPGLWTQKLAEGRPEEGSK